MTNKLQILQEQVSEVKNENKKLEDEHDSWDERNRNIRSELKNLVELSKLYESKTDIYKRNRSYHNEESRKLILMLCRSYGIILGTILTYLFYFAYTGEYKLLPLPITSVSLYFVDLYYNIVNYRRIVSVRETKLKQEDNEIKDKNVQIKELQDMNDWVTNYIDTL